MKKKKDQKWFCLNDYLTNTFDFRAKLTQGEKIKPVKVKVLEDQQVAYLMPPKVLAKEDKKFHCHTKERIFPKHISRTPTLKPSTLDTIPNEPLVLYKVLLK